MLIICFLEQTFKLLYSSYMLTDNVLFINDKHYEVDNNSKENQGFLGFFDWLRIDESTIVGIRISYLEHQLYNEILMQYPYVIPTFGNRCMEIFFKKNIYIPSISGDQDFTNNYVYKSRTEDYLFTFGLDHLTDEELKSLLSNCEII